MIHFGSSITTVSLEIDENCENVVICFMIDCEWRTGEKELMALQDWSPKHGYAFCF